MDIIIICHTEFGFVHKKKFIPDKNAYEGASKGVANLIGIAKKYGARITFAVSPEVVTHFPKGISHEIGLHIHPGWEELESGGLKYHVGDQYLRQNCRQSITSTALKDYSYDEQLDMITTGKTYLANMTGVEPSSFVAGRWSINNDTIRALIKTGFTHECSALPHSKPCHYDWSRLPRICMPYHPASHDYQAKGDLPVLMVPTSQVFPVGVVSPEFAPEVGLSWLKACFAEYYYQDLPLFHICLHSPSMTDDYFISIMDNYLNFISKHERINFRFSSEIYEYYEIHAKTHFHHYLSAINFRLLRKFIEPRIKQFLPDFSN